MKNIEEIRQLIEKYGKEKFLKLLWNYGYAYKQDQLENFELVHSERHEFYYRWIFKMFNQYYEIRGYYPSSEDLEIEEMTDIFEVVEKEKTITYWKRI